MPILSPAPGRLLQRVAAFNKRGCFLKNVKFRCRDGVASSSFVSSFHSLASTPLDTDTIKPITSTETMVNTVTERMNLFTAINNALYIALKTDPSSILFGQGKSFPRFKRR